MQYRESWADVKAGIAAKYAQHTQIIETVECPHEQTEFRRLPIANGRWQLRKQCQDCGELIGGAVKRETVKDCASLPLVDENLRNARDRQWQERRDYREQCEAESHEAFWRYYADYITSAEWQQKRSLVLRRAKGICEGCGLKSPEHVHHQTYEHLGDEFLFELVAICRECHQKIHPHREID